MELQTKVDIAPSPWQIGPCEEILCVGSCFADNIGRCFVADAFPAVVNPFGVMYNPLSVVHTLQRLTHLPACTILSLGTTHVYVDKATGAVVDNCQRRPASDFEERVLTVEECVEALRAALALCGEHVVLTVSPIRYKKYGYHGSLLAKSTLLLAVEEIVQERPQQAVYFPAYEIVNDELRDYRFYAPDMLHPSPQTIDYLYSRFVGTFFSAAAKEFLRAWQPLKEALGHRPFSPDSADYQAFLAQTQAKIRALQKQYPQMVVPAQDGTHS